MVVGGDPPDPDKEGFAGTVYMVLVCKEHDPDPSRSMPLPRPPGSVPIGERPRRWMRLPLPQAPATGWLDQQRMYQLVPKQGPFVDRMFEIGFLDRGVEAVAFAFGWWERRPKLRDRSAARALGLVRTMVDL
jgi:hypothetical protein